jgi:hypothetical protein
MARSIDVDTQGGHQYVVRLRDGDDVSESWFNITPEVLERLRVGAGNEEDVVRRTAEFLAERQDVADYPAVVELEDVIATYDDYLDVMVG